MQESLLISNEGRLRRLTLNRPDQRNALNANLCRSLVDAVEQANADKAVGAILLDANGKDFCAGMDLKEAAETGPDSLLPLHQALFTAGERLRKPMVAAVQGSAFAGGLGLALNAHMVIADEEARFGLTEVRVGLWPYLVFPLVAGAVGTRKATELSVSARIIDVGEACCLGLADIVAQSGALREEAQSIARSMADGSATASELGLSYVQQLRGLDSASAAKLAAEYRRKAHKSADFREGVLAFRAKRGPAWPSHEALTRGGENDRTAER